MKFFAVYFLFTSLLLLTSCSMVSKKINGFATVPLKKPIFIHLKGIQGFEEVSRLYSKTVVSERTHEKSIIKETKFADFDVKTETLLVDRGQAHIHFLLKTIKSSGNMDLNDLAMPKLNEELRVTMYPNAEVVNVEGKERTSIFYVPPISLPLHKVSVGDTWKFKRIWLTGKTKIPVQIDMVTTFKNYLNCGQNRMCADLEINGEISLPTADIAKVQIKSKMRGRILFTIRSGSVLWSHVRSTEEITAGKSTQIVQSCTKSALIEPKSESAFEGPGDCNPLVSESLIWPSELSKP